jgi:hypothetical protein
LSPDCSCPDWGWPCKHASALCYQIGALLDVDPFVLLLLRGRGETELMEELRTRNAAAAVAQAGGDVIAVGTAGDIAAPGVSASEVFAAAPRDAAALIEGIAAFELPALPAVPGPPPVLATATDREIDTVALERLAGDTARRAHALRTAYTRSEDPATVPLLPRLTTWQDAVRLAADEDEGESEEVYERVLFAYDLGDVRMTMSIHAWRQGGPVGLDTLETPWTPTASDKARARQSLEDWADEDGGDPPVLRVWRNRWTADSEGLQVRLGTDGRWYPYRRDPEDGGWWPHGAAEHDFASALAGLLAAG